MVVVVAAACAVAGWLGWMVSAPVTPSGEKFVLLRPGYSTRRIASELKSAGVIRNEDAFLFWHYLKHGKSLKAGEYRFASAASIAEIHKRLVRGDIYTHTVVIPEGYTMFDVAQALDAAHLCSRDEFLKVAQSETSLIQDLAPEAKTLEGYLFPDTYEFTRLQTPHDIAAAMVRHFRQVATTIGLTTDVQRVVIMASIIEKETGAPEERAKVASVYYNRLARRMALDADPSVIYAELLAGTYQGTLSHDDLLVPSPYNTYRNAGMPPGPIANPGKDALEAALHPARTEYLYFVSDANGHHRFARSLEEHNQNINAYRKALRAQQ